MRLPFLLFLPSFLILAFPYLHILPSLPKFSSYLSQILRFYGIQNYFPLPSETSLPSFPSLLNPCLPLLVSSPFVSYFPYILITSFPFQGHPKQPSLRLWDFSSYFSFPSQSFLFHSCIFILRILSPHPIYHTLSFSGSFLRSHAGNTSVRSSSLQADSEYPWRVSGYILPIDHLFVMIWRM